MLNLSSLLETHKQWLTTQHQHKTSSLHLEFKILLQNIKKENNTSNQKLKYPSQHAQFLLETLAQPSQSHSHNFTILVQISNIVLKTQQKIKIHTPKLLFDTLNQQIECNNNYQQSPTLISEIVWLVGKCIQLSKDPHSIMQRLSQIKLLDNCLKCQHLQPTADRGISLLLGFMSKLQLLQEQSILNLIPNLHKFRQQQSIEQLVLLLKQATPLLLKNSNESTLPIVQFVINYIHDPMISWEEKEENWQVILTAAHLHPSLAQDLQIPRLLKNKLRDDNLQISEQTLTLAVETASQLAKDAHNERELVAEASKTALMNPLAKRILIQYHQKIDADLLVSILASPLPDKLAQRISNEDSQQTSLKILICLKRTSNILGLNNFFDYKFQALCQQITNNFSFHTTELIDLWKEVNNSQSLALNRKSLPMIFF